MANVKHYKEVPILPKEFTECEYLESTGTQSILLPIKGSNNIRITIDFALNKEEGRIFGYGKSIPRFAFLVSASGYFTFQYGDANIITNIKADCNRHVITMDNQGVIFDGAKILSFDNISFETNGHLFLFSYNGTSTIYCSVRLYKFFVETINGNAIFDSHWSLDNNNTPCIYDTISQQLFYNQGTGEFLYKVAEKPTMKLEPMVQMYHKGVPYFKEKVKKPRLPEWLQEVEYLESTGEQWIDTGIKCTHIAIKTKAHVLENDYAYKSIYWTRAKRQGLLPTYGCIILSNTDIRAYAGHNGGTQNLTRVDYFDYNNINVEVFDNTLILNDKVYSINSERYDVDYNLVLWQLFEDGAKYQTQTGKGVGIYYFEVRKSDKLLLNLIPCRFKTSHTCIDGNTLQEVTMPANKPCMYDMVTGHCFFNQSTGADFLVGEDKDTMVEVTDNTGIVEMYSRGDRVRGKEDKPYKLYDALVGDGNSWIVTNVAPSVDAEIRCAFSIISLYTRYVGVYGARPNSSAGITFFITQPTTISMGWAGLRMTNTLDNILEGVHNIVHNKNKFQIDENIYKQNTGAFVPTSLNIFRDVYGTPQPLYGKFYNFIIEDVEGIILDMKPCKLTQDISADKASDNKPHSAGECGMWDMVSDKFFGNANSEGEFTVE